MRRLSLGRIHGSPTPATSLRNGSEAKFYVDMEHGDMFEEGADGVFVLKRIDGRRK